MSLLRKVNTSWLNALADIHDILIVILIILLNQEGLKDQILF